MKKIEVLQWGLRHIAGNYKMGASVGYEDDGQLCVFVTDKHPDVTPAPINDVEMLCDDLGIDRIHVDVSPYGIDVWLDYAWVHTKAESAGCTNPGEAGMLLEEYVPTGREMWHKYGVKIGSPIKDEPEPDANGSEPAAVSVDSATADCMSIYEILPF